jgi:hypothetical protein
LTNDRTHPFEVFAMMGFTSFREAKILPTRGSAAIVWLAATKPRRFFKAGNVAPADSRNRRGDRHVATIPNSGIFTAKGSHLRESKHRLSFTIRAGSLAQVVLCEIVAGVRTMNGLGGDSSRMSRSAHHHRKDGSMNGFGSTSDEALRTPSICCIDVVLNDRSAPNFTKAFEIIREQGGATVAVGRHPNRLLDGKPICYLKVGGRGGKSRKIATRLADAGYTVLAVHPSSSRCRRRRETNH